MLSFYNTSSLHEKFSNKKCAEVFCQAMDSFSIVCTFCEMKSFAFDDFLMHFKNVHLDNTVASLNPLNIKQEEDVDEFHPELALLREEENFPDKKETIESDENSEGSVDAKEVTDDEDYIPKILKSPKAKGSAIQHKCGECSRSYKRKKTLEYHINKYHNAENKFKCDACKITFDTEASLDIHSKTKHVRFPCSQCDKTYKTRRVLKMHALSHTLERNFLCDFENCSKAFNTLKSLKRHKIHTHNTERNYVCETCGFRTKTKNDLEIHYRSHTGEKPYACEVCERRFASSSLLKEHMAMHLTEKPHVCDVCGASFTRPKSLYHHRHLHLGIKKFVCKICGKAYAQAAGLCAHMKQHKADQAY